MAEIDDNITYLLDKVKNLIWIKNKHEKRLTSVELGLQKNIDVLGTIDPPPAPIEPPPPPAPVNRLEIGDKLILIGTGDHAGVWVKKDDGNWYQK